MPTVHLICGPIGAGKTAYATALAARCRGVRLSMDEWMEGLFAADRPEPHDYEWALERMARCEERMWIVADAILALGTDLVFDVGLGRRDERDRWRTRAQQSRGAPKLHYLDVDADIRRARVLRRNEEQGETYSLEVTDKMFDAMESRFEPPTDDELYDAMIVVGD